MDTDVSRGGGGGGTRVLSFGRQQRQGNQKSAAIIRNNLDRQRAVISKKEGRDKNAMKDEAE